jgi:hypothetical protein
VEQKINYLALHDAFKYRRLKRLQWHKEPINAENIIWNCNINLKAYQDMINARFRNYNFSNFLRLENTLKDDFWLTNIESQQLKKYLLLVKDHPEYIKTQPQLAISKPVIFGGGLVLWLILWIFWILWFIPKTLQNYNFSGIYTSFRQEKCKKPHVRFHVHAIFLHTTASLPLKDLHRVVA